MRIVFQFFEFTNRLFTLTGNYYLLVAQDVHDRDITQRMFTTTLPWTVGLILIFGLLGGALMSRNMLRRLDAINRASGEIMAGNLTMRVPVTDAHDEFDVLSENLNRMLDRIEQLLKGLREVTDSVAHDLRGPLTRLRNRLELLAASRQIDPVSLEECVEQADSLLDIFNALLRIARIESGTYRSAFAPTDLSHLVQEVCSLFQVAADERGITFRAELSPGISVVGDRELLAQGLSNLLDNAIKYTPSGGTIVVTLERAREGYAGLTVADSGPGIPAADRERVLERFHRLDLARTLPGSGLGLSLVKAIVEQHRGALHLSDNEPGLAVTMELPLEQSQLGDAIGALHERAGFAGERPA